MVANQSDGQLLERFVARQDGDSGAEAAFAEIVRRHGPLVLRVCRNILGDPHDAQDAVQATFLVLVRKAGSIRRRDSIAGWLHGTALRVARRARADAARRRLRERQGGVSEVIDPDLDEGRREGWSELHEELARLPEKYRVPLVLCYLEGMTTEVAARQIGCPQGTILCRLSRGRQRLRGRLIRRGLTASAVVLLLDRLPEAKASLTISAGEVTSTVRAALQFAAEGSGAIAVGTVSARGSALAKGVLRTMFMTKIKLLGVVVLAGAAVAVVLPISPITRAQQQPRDEARPKANTLKPKVDERWVKKLPSGAVVELVAISTYPSGPNTWWMPGVGKLSEPPFASGGARGDVRPKEQLREFVIRLRDLPDKDADHRWKTLNSSFWGASNLRDQDGRRIVGMEMILATLPDDLTSSTIGFGLAAGPWNVKAGCESGGEAALGFEKLGIIFGRSHETQGRSTISVSFNTLDQAVRIVAIDRNGEIHTASRTSFLSARDVAQQTLEFPLALESIKEFQFQTRPYEWAEFKDVPLQPPTTSK